MRLRLFQTRANLRSLRARRSFAAASHVNEFDYVVVGAGSAGCTITCRLAESGSSVCLVEAGLPIDMWEAKMPYYIGWSKLISNKMYDWTYTTVQQKHLNNRTIYWPRGKGIGGTSSINAMVFMRGNALDYDRWAFSENAPGWSYADVLPYFKRMETYHANADLPTSELHKYRGMKGPLHVTAGQVRNEESKIDVARVFLGAAVEAGYRFTHDMNGYRQEGVGWFDATVYNGERMSTGNTFLKMAARTNNVDVRTGVMCAKIQFDQANARAIGVEVARASDNRVVSPSLEVIYARKDVIVCGGAVNSPQLLMLSGIGNADYLRSVGVKPIVDLPGVGRNLQDHIRIEVSCKSIKLHTHEQDTSEAEQLWHNARSGLLSTNIAEVGAQVCTRESFQHPNMQIHFFPLAITDRFKLTDHPALLMSANTHREHSRGTIKLRSANPFDYPVIDPNLMSDTRDLEELVDTLKVCRNIFHQKSFAKYVISEMQPGEQVVSDKDIKRWICEACASVFHPCGTCKMGDIRKDGQCVVDPSNMKVYGVDGLRVVDASVMPSEVSGNLNGPTIMIAERASDLILGKLPLREEAASFRKRL